MSTTLFTLKPITDQEIISLAKGKEVTNNKDLNLSFDSKVPEEKGGLYDPAIFGIAKRCNCSVTRLKSGDPPKVCPNCKALVFSTSDEWKNNIAFYRLKIPYIFPYKIAKFLKVLSTMGIYPIYGEKKGQWYDGLFALWNSSYTVEPTDKDSEALLVKDGQLYKLIVSEVQDVTDYKTIGLLGLYELQAYKLKNGSQIDFTEYLNTCVPIISTYFRKYIRLQTEKPILQIDEKTLQYKAIIESNMLLDTYSANIIDSAIDRATMMYNINMLVARIVFNTEILQGGKYHTTRDNLRQRVKRSLRANIIPALDIDMNHIKVPESLAYAALNEDIIQKLMEEEKMERYEAVSSYKQKSVEALKAFHELVDMSMVVFLRQPVLHKYGMFALHPIISDKPALEIPIDLCVPLNGDFDGDQCACFFVLEQDICAQLECDMKPEQVWFYEKENKPIFTPTHEILYGLHLATTYGKPTKKEFGTFEELEQAYKNGKLEFDDVVMLNDRKNSYGRAKIEHILNMDLDAGLGDDEPITTKNIDKIVSAMSSHRHRAREMHELTEFATEIITHVGMDTPPFEELYDKDDPEIQKLINSEDPVSVKYTKLNDYISKLIKNKTEHLEGSSLPSMLKGSGRVKASQLEEIYSPAIYIDKDDVTISNRTLFAGQTERDFVKKSLENRIVQQIKKDGVPVGGYATRQMVLSQMDIIFVDKTESPDTIGLEIPLSEASGRTRLNGTVISDEVAQKANKEAKIKVKSCLNHKEMVVYADEIDQRDLKEKDGAAIGVSFAMSLTEAKTQSILGLKHGGIKREFEDEHILAYRSGTVESFDSEFMYVTTSEGQTDKYLMCEKTIPTVKFGQYVKAGDELATSNRLKQLHDQIADFEAFIGIQGIYDSGLNRETGRGLVMRYAPCDGEIKYPSPYTIQIGSLSFNVNRQELYYYPEGYKVKTGDSICSGVLDMAYFVQLNKNTQQCFDAFKKQMLDTYPNQKLRNEIYEVTYKALREEFNAKRTYSNTDNFINRLYVGDTKHGVQKFFKESGDNVIKIKDSLILPLVLGFDTKDLQT